MPPTGWMGMYGQPPPFMHPPPHMPPPQEVGEDTFEQAPPFITPFPDDSGASQCNLTACVDCCMNRGRGQTPLSSQRTRVCHGADTLHMWIAMWACRNRKHGHPTHLNLHSVPMDGFPNPSMTAAFSPISQRQSYAGWRQHCT